MRIRVGLIGLGDAWQQRHAPALHTLADRFEVRAICEQVAHRAEQAAVEFSAAAIDGYRALSRREDIDAVLVLAPQWYGALPILAACEAGKAIYCAAGLDLELEEAILVKRRVEQAGVAFMAEFPRRHASATIRLKELIATHLGTPQLLFCHRRSTVRPACNHHCGPARRSAALRELVELVDWCRYIVDVPPSSVTGLVHGNASEGRIEEDYHMMSLDFSASGSPGTGPVAQISCGTYIPAHWREAVVYRPPAGLQVICTSGVAFIDLPSTLVWFDEAGRHQESLESERPVGEQLLSQFHRMLSGPARKTSDLEEAYLALSIVEQARRSHAEGRRIELV
jgi:predicted dehydrogenase